MKVYVSPFLLADPSPCLRWLALRDVFGMPEDAPEMKEIEAQRAADPLAAGLASRQEENGSWSPSALGIHWGAGSRTIATSLALTRLGNLGFDRGFEVIRRGADFLFSQQAEDGSWPLSREGAALDGHLRSEESSVYSMIPLQTAFPLRGLAASGFAEDSRAERAYDWLIAQRLEDGAWPTGWASGVHGYVAGYRRLAHSRWGCRINTTAALICLAHHPARRYSAEARRGLDVLLGRETREEATLGFEAARLAGAEEMRGFISHFARFDPGLIADLCWRIGASAEDSRVADLANFISGARGEYGLWDYAPKPQASRWVSLDLTRSLLRLAEGGDWVGEEPRTPFQPYPKQKRRF
jgi:hypothetical protein